MVIILFQNFERGNHESSRIRRTLLWILGRPQTSLLFARKTSVPIDAQPKCGQWLTFDFPARGPSSTSFVPDTVSCLRFEPREPKVFLSVANHRERDWIEQLSTVAERQCNDLQRIRNIKAATCRNRVVLDLGDKAIHEAVGTCSIRIRPIHSVDAFRV